MYVTFNMCAQYDLQLAPDYSSVLPVSNAKKDLLSLLRDREIPDDYRNFVMMLPTSAAVKLNL